jgi:hypothetical protein
MELLSANEMAEATGYSFRHLLYLRREGLLDAAYGPDGALRFFASDIEWLRDRKARAFGRPNKEDAHG